MFQSLKEESAHFILSDDLDRARFLLKNPSRDLRLLSDLLKKVKNKSLPLKDLEAEKPKFITINSSYTCGLGCRMCNSGFHDRTFLFDDYKYFLPEQFDQLSPWLESASNIIFVGAGETLESPHTTYFLGKIKEKESQIYTSGVPLNKKRIRSLIQSKLKILTLSFDGETTLGHGAGEKSYIQKFWEKAEIVQREKRELNSTLPVVVLLIAINGENIDNLDEVIQTASRKGIRDIMLSSMLPFSEYLYKKSIFSNFEESKRKINSLISRWDREEMHITFLGHTKKMQDSVGTCPYVDNWINFHGKNKPNICCGPIELPMNISESPNNNSWNSFPMRYFLYTHFCSNGEKIPHACQNCWAINLKQFSQTCADLYNNPENKGAAPEFISLYHTASELKQHNKVSEAEKLFAKVLNLKINPEIRGKTYFHLGEIRLMQKNYTQALSCMKLAVQYCFNHQMAFAYLYLLLMLEENPKPVLGNKKFNLDSCLNNREWDQGVPDFEIEASTAAAP